MAASGEVLDLIFLLDKIGWDIGFLLGYLRDESEAGNLPRVFEPEYVEKIQALKTIASLIVKAKQEPGRELTDEVLGKLTGIMGDTFLDEYFTILELKAVPGVVKRWKNLRALRVGLVPGEKVTEYMRQATTCYLYGLYNAAAILCRAVVQFALEEAFERWGGLDLSRVGRKDYIESLINFALNTKILSPELAAKAHKTRKIGNDSVHKANCTEAKALDALGCAGDVLAGIYG